MPPHPMSSTPPQRGFTLIEILAVLTIVASVAALMVPALTRTTAAEHQATARTLSSALRFTRGYALAHNEPGVLVLDLERREFEFPGAKKPRELPGELGLKLVTARSERESETRGRIRFFPDGSSTGGRISVGTGAGTRHVDVDWLTGRIRILTGVEG